MTENILEILHQTINNKLTLQELDAILKQAYTITKTNLEGKYIGVISGRFIWDPQFAQVIFYVNYLAVENSHQNQGVGTELLKALESDCYKAKIKLIRLRSLDTLTKFYMDTGFKVTSEPFEDDGHKYVYLEKVVVKA